MKTHQVIDIVYTAEEGNVVFSGTYQECLDWMEKQGFGYRIVPIVDTHISNQKRWDDVDLLDVMSLGMDLRQNQLNGQCDRSGVDVLNDWIERNSKIK